MSVAFDAIQTATADGNGVTSLNLTTLTVGSGLNRALVVALNFSVAVTSVSVHWDTAGTNQALTQIGTTKTITSGGTNNSQLWGLVAPTSGNKTLGVTWTTSAQLVIAGISFTGVNQTGGTTSFANFNSSTGDTSTATVTVTSNGNDAVVATGTDTGNQNPSSVNNTQWFIDHANNNTWGNYLVPGSASSVMSATLSGTDFWVQIGCDVVASAAACIPSRTLVGVGCALWAERKLRENPWVRRRDLIVPRRRL